MYHIKYRLGIYLWEYSFKFKNPRDIIEEFNGISEENKIKLKLIDSKIYKYLLSNKLFTINIVS